jgi:hypothetical protein
MKSKRKPSAKQIKLAQIKLEKPGLSKYQQAIEAGYSPNSAKNPQDIEQTDSWKALMEQYFPDDKLAKKIDEGLEATKVVTSPTEPDKEVEDYATRHKYLDTALKLKGKYPESKSGVGVSVTPEGTTIVVTRG